MSRMLIAKVKIFTCIAAVFVMLLTAIAPMNALAADNGFYITVSQTCDADSVQQAMPFIYELKALDEKNPMPPQSAEGIYRFSITGTGSTKIGPLVFEQPGIYRYEIYQDAHEMRPCCNHDQSVYTIEIYVTESLDASMVIINHEGKKAEEIEFKNTLGFIYVDPQIHKVVRGNPPTDGTFTFRMEAQNISNPMPAGSKDGVKTITVTGPGMGDFGDIMYPAGLGGTFRYYIYEVNTGLPGYTYDTMVYTLTDTIVVRDGEHDVSRTITDSNNRQVTDMVFVNRYNENSGTNPTPRPGSPAGPAGSGSMQRPGMRGPKTGDELDNTLYIILFALGSIMAIGAAVYLIARSRREREGRQI